MSNKLEQRRRVEEVYEDQLRVLNEEIDRVRDEGAETLQTLRKSQFQRLTNLIERKKTIELGLVRHAGELQEAYERVRGELGVVLEGRMVDLRGREGEGEEDGGDGVGDGDGGAGTKGKGKGKARAAE